MNSFEELIDQHPDLSAQLAEQEPAKSATSLAGLLTVPALHPYNLRIETLIHLVLILGNGSKRPRSKDLDRWLAEIGTGMCGWLEDPPEGVFASNICTAHGNFRIFEGIWDSAAFHLQRFVDVLEHMPQGAFYDYVRDCSFALLRLSEAIAARANVERFASVDAYDLREQRESASFGSPSALRGLVQFSEEELRAIGVTSTQLEPFSLLPEHFSALDAQSSGSSRLERQPVVLQRDKASLLLPNAVSVAIRLFVVDQLREAGLLEPLHKALTQSYRDLLKETPILGEMFHTPLRFQRSDGTSIAQIALRADRGKCISLLVLVDGFDDFDGDLSESRPAEKLERELSARIAKVQKEISKTHTVEDGVHLVISCGWGRAASLGLPPPSPTWRIVHVPAADIVTMSWSPTMEVLDLWRLLDAEDQLSQEGVYIQNASGLLNLYGWWKRTNFTLLPRIDPDSDFRLPDLLSIPTDCLWRLGRRFCETSMNEWCKTLTVASYECDARRQPPSSKDWMKAGFL